MRINIWYETMKMIYYILRKIYIVKGRQNAQKTPFKGVFRFLFHIFHEKLVFKNTFCGFLCRKHVQALHQIADNVQFHVLLKTAEHL